MDGADVSRCTHVPGCPSGAQLAKRPGWWIILGGMICGLGYIPSLAMNFDFIDDGNLVYPAPPGLSAMGHVELWWQRVVANVEHLGPFRPVLWVHWQIQAELCQADPIAWRCLRLAWCGWAATMFLWLMHEFGISRKAALLATLAAMWNPYRNEIWTSLTLAEGVAMPYALLSLIAARRAGRAGQRSYWDLLSLGCLVACLGCKNTFVALVPAMIWLRLAGRVPNSLRELRGEAALLAMYLLPLLLPVGHFIYFQMHWQPGHYTTPGPSVAQLGRILSWMKGAAGLDFLAVASVGLFVVAWQNRTVIYSQKAPVASSPRLLLGTAALLLTAGISIYAFTNIMAARYTMPAIWGADLLYAYGLTWLLQAPHSRLKSITLAAVLLGTLALAVAHIGRQEKVAARTELLWKVLYHIEATAPAAATIEWQAGPVNAGYFDEEEGIHLAWHLAHRGRDDLRFRLLDPTQQVISRVELPTATQPGYARVLLQPGSASLASEPHFTTTYRFGRKRLQASCLLLPASVPTSVPDSFQMSEAELEATLRRRSQVEATELAEQKRKPRTP